MSVKPNSKAYAQSWRQGLPESFSSRYTHIARLMSRSQGTQLYIIENHFGARHVIKLHEPESNLNLPILTKLSGANVNYLAQVNKFGYENKGRGRAWEMMEYFSNGNLKSLFQNKTDFVDYDTILDVVRQVHLSLRYLHRQKIVHGNLKLTNIFVRSRSPLKIVLGDYGAMSKWRGRILHGQLSCSVNHAAPEIIVSRLNRSQGGVTNYRVDSRLDYWSLGMLIVEMITGKNPMEGKSEIQIYQWLRKNSSKKLVSGVSHQKWRELCAGLLQKERHKRWGLIEVDEWLRGYSGLTLKKQ